MAATTTYRRRRDVAVVESPVESRVVAMPLNGTQPYVLTNSAALIWGLVDGQRDVNAIVRAIRSDFPDADGIEESAQQFLHELQGLHLVEPVENPTW